MNRLIWILAGKVPGEEAFVLLAGVVATFVALHRADDLQDKSHYRLTLLLVPFHAPRNLMLGRSNKSDVERNRWISDSGANISVVNERKWFKIFHNSKAATETVNRISHW